MGHVQIAADQHRFLRVQFQQIVAESILPYLPVRQPGQSVLGVRRVHIYQIKLRELTGDDTAFVVMLVDTETVRNVKRLFLREHSRTGITFLLRAVPVFKIVGEIKGRLFPLHLGLLHAEDIRVRRRHKIRKAFGHTGPQPVHIPGNQFHKYSSFFLKLINYKTQNRFRIL